MAQTVEELAEILNNLKLENENNAEGFDRALTTINNKLDMMAEDTEAYDSIKIYISELKRAVEDKHKQTVSLFDGIETSIENVSKLQEQNAKTSQIQELFQVLNDQVNSFSLEISLNADLIKEVNEKLEAIQNDKEGQNNIINGLDVLSEKVEKYSALLDELKFAVMGVSEETNAFSAEQFEKLQNELSSVVTETDFADFRKGLADLIQTITDNASFLNSEISNNSTQLENILSEIKAIDYNGDFESVSSKLDDLLKDTENTPKLLSATDAIAEKLDVVSFDINEAVENAANETKENLNNIEDLITNISVELANKKDELSSLVSSNSEHNYAELKNVNDNIVKLHEALNSVNIEYKAVIEDKVAAIKAFVTEVGDSLYDSNSQNSAKLEEKLNLLYDLNHGFEASLIDVNVNLQNILKNLMTMDVTEQNDIIKRELENIYISANAVLSALKISDQKNDEIADIITNLANKEDLENIQAKFEEINARAQEIAVNISQLPVKDDFVQLTNKFDDFSSNIKELQEILQSVSGNNDLRLLEQLNKFEKDFSNIITKEDFSEFKSSFSEFIEKILDNSSVLNLNSDANKLRIGEILEKLDSFNYSDDLKNISLSIDDIKNSFENNSKMNYENLSNELMMLSERFNERFDGLDVKNKNALFDIKNDIDNVISTFDDVKAELIQNSNANLLKISDAFQEIYEKTINLINGFDDKSDDDSNCLEDSIAELSAKFEDFELSLKNISTIDSDSVISEIKDVTKQISDLRTEFLQTEEANVTKLSDTLETASLKIDNIQDNLALEVANSFSDLKDMFANLSNELNDVQTKNSDFYRQSNQYQAEKLEMISTDLKDIESAFSKMADSQKQHIENLMEDLRHYVEELNISAKSNGDYNEKVFSEKLLNLENLFSSSVSDYDEKLDILQTKLGEYIKSVETISSDTDVKIDNSIAEISAVKLELTSLADTLKSNFDTSDGRLVQMMSLLEAGIKSVSDTISELGSSVKNNSSVDDNLKDYLASVDEKFENLLSLADVLKTDSDNSKQEILNNLEEKINLLKQELNLVNTDIIDIFNNRAEDLINRFIPLQAEIEKFASLDFCDTITNIKEQLDFSYMNISSDLTNGFVDNQEAIAKLEQVYKETLIKLSDIEDCLKEQTQENLELLGLAVENVNKNVSLNIEKTNSFIEQWQEGINQIKDKLVAINTSYSDSLSLLQNDISNTIDEKLTGYIDDLKSCLSESVNSEELQQAVDILKRDLSEKFNNLLVEIANDDSSHENFKEGLAAVQNTLKEYIQDETKKVLETVVDINTNIALDSDLIKDSNDSLKALHQKMDLLVTSIDEDNDNDYAEAFETLNNKIDVMASDTSIIDLNDKIDDVVLTEDKIAESLMGLHQKVDTLIEPDDTEDKIAESLLGLHQKVDTLVAADDAEDRIAETLMVLHQKVDTLALFNDSEDFDAETEIEDIKSLILEQRKYFENSELNERTEAISSCLEELLGKIQNIENGLNDVDLDKNTQDIKESIMAAIISVFEQVSFVEETEEIKDFVEEKTEEISQHLQEVRDQLKQIANSDDFGYSYTLQDVESDIAKLRIALNDISNSTSKDDINDLSRNINKIALSVENIQSSLTPDQMFDLKEDIEKLNDDIISISSRTNKLLLTSDESYKALSSGLDKFSNVVSNLEEKISYIDYAEINERFEKKIDAIKSMVASSVNADKVFHQVLMYLGEWVDSASENMASIAEKTSEVKDVKNMIQELKVSVPDKSEILEELEERFENQESRIDRLERKIEKILSTLEEKDDMVLNNKVDKIEKQLSKLSANIEKLASYVDEE